MYEGHLSLCLKVATNKPLIFKNKMFYLNVYGNNCSGLLAISAEIILNGIDTWPS